MSTVNKSIHSLPCGFTPPHLLCDLPEDSPVLVGLSGGADSTALLHMLKNFSERSGAKIYAAHINHGIRGEEADRDEAFCKEFAKALGVEFISIKADIPSLARKNSQSVETAARSFRYSFFDSLMQEKQIKILATAHNADDNLETLIFNVTRGAGLGGMCGIPRCRPCAAGVVVRPILSMEKSEILEYCQQNSLSFVTDSTNLQSEYTRNKIRISVIPVLKQINSGASKNALRLTDSLREDSLCLQSMTEWFLEELGWEHSIELEKLCSSPSAVVNRALIRMYEDISGTRTLEAVHVKDMYELAKKGVPHSSLSLPGKINAVVENNRLCLVKASEKQPELKPYKTVLEDGKNYISQIRCEIFKQPSHSLKNIYKNSILLSFPRDKIFGSLIARNRLSGDTIRINGMSKDVKKLISSKKIPLDMRPRLPVICDEHGIVAIPFVGVRDGARVGAAHKCLPDGNGEERCDMHELLFCFEGAESDTP